MSETAGVMDCRLRPRQRAMLLIVLLLKSTNIIWLYGTPITGADYNVHCVNDYLFTVNCSLSITPSENTSYWLSFTETEDKKQYTCMLTNTKEDYFCTFKTTDGMSEDDYIDIFGDLDTYSISLCHDGNEENETCEVLQEDYEPVNNIKPNAPCCLSVSRNSGQHRFAWESIYKNYSVFTELPNNLQYQLHYYKRGEHEVKLHDIYTESMNYSVEDQNFGPDTEYSARVRCSPNQAFYRGEWSDWSPEAHWRTEPALIGFSAQTFISEMCQKVLLPICGLVVIVLLMCYGPIKKWRQNVFIPTPAPYFHTLYSDCQGDFKSWVVTHENTADMLKKEETLHIDILTKCAEVQEDDCPPEFNQHVMEGSSYSNITAPVYDTDLLGIPYAVSTMTPLSLQGGSMNSIILGSKLGSPAGDSGCWLCSDVSLEREPPWYCNEYCTLSAFQQSGCIPAEDHVSL